MKYLIETHGCQMNAHDSERMAGLLEQAGYEPASDDSDADVIVINTCSVRERAEEKLFTRLGEIRQAVHATAHVTDLGVNATRRGSALAEARAARLDSISQLQSQSVAAVKEVATLAEHQELRAADLTAALSMLHGATRSRTQAAPPLVAAGKSLESIARRG